MERQLATVNGVSNAVPQSNHRDTSKVSNYKEMQCINSTFLNKHINVLFDFVKNVKKCIYT